MLDNLLLLVYVIAGTALAITAVTVISVTIASILLWINDRKSG